MNTTCRVRNNKFTNLDEGKQQKNNKSTKQKRSQEVEILASFSRPEGV